MKEHFPDQHRENHRAQAVNARAPQLRAIVPDESKARDAGVLLQPRPGKIQEFVLKSRGTQRFIDQKQLYRLHVAAPMVAQRLGRRADERCAVVQAKCVWSAHPMLQRGQRFTIGLVLRSARAVKRNIGAGPEPKRRGEK